MNKTVPTVGQNVCTIDLPDMYLKIWDVGGQHALRGLWTKYYGSCHAIVFVIDSSDVGDGELDDALLEEEDEEEEEDEDDDNDDDDDDDDDDGDGEEDDEGEKFTTPDAASGGGKKPEKAGKPKKKRPKKNLSTTTSSGGAAAHDEDEGGRLAECALVLSSVLSSTSTTGIPVLVLANKQDREDCVETVRIKEGLVRKVFEGGGEGGAGGAVRDSRVLPVSALKGTGVREAVEWVRSRVKWNREGRPPVMR